MALSRNFVKNLKKALEEAEISQAELARLSGVHYVTINRILHGHLNPTIDTCEALAKALGIKPEYAFSAPARRS
ncbi:MAG: helix-turn-helix transcriptional regulator [Pirellulales bacterium]|nr:helix-turn-helix transcriptional regulator [Pirellulales bacterium]